MYQTFSTLHVASSTAATVLKSMVHTVWLGLGIPPPPPNEGYVHRRRRHRWIYIPGSIGQPIAKNLPHGVVVYASRFMSNLRS